MTLDKNTNYYYALIALRYLLKLGKITEDEYGKICRYNAEFFQPDTEYI